LQFRALVSAHGGPASTAAYCEAATRGPAKPAAGRTGAGTPVTTRPAVVPGAPQPPTSTSTSTSNTTRPGNGQSGTKPTGPGNGQATGQGNGQGNGKTTGQGNGKATGQGNGQSTQPTVPGNGPGNGPSNGPTNGKAKGQGAAAPGHSKAK
jgi:hypothetical protein